MIAGKVIAYLSESKGLPDEVHVDPETPLIRSGLVDSLGMEDLVLFLEGTFDISIDDDDMMPENFDTVAAITALVERKLAQACG